MLFKNKKNDNDIPKKKSRVKKAATFILLPKVIPKLGVKKTITDTSDRINNLKSDIIKAYSTEKSDFYNLDFEDAIKNRQEGSLTIEQLKQNFLTNKRVVVICGFILFCLGLLGLLSSIINISLFTAFISTITIFCSFILTLFLSMRFQLRIWQLTEKRLSIKEKGGMFDFMQETYWLIDSLNLSGISHKKAIQNEKQ